jgi:hypothetical protein
VVSSQQEVANAYFPRFEAVISVERNAVGLHHNWLIDGLSIKQPDACEVQPKPANYLKRTSNPAQVGIRNKLSVV